MGQHVAELVDASNGIYSHAYGLFVTKAHGVLESRLKATIDWLSPTPYDHTHVAARGRRQRGTGQWFVEKIRAWLAESNRSPIFWCRGIREYPYNMLRTWGLYE